MDQSNSLLNDTLVTIGVILGVVLLLYLIRKFIQGPFYKKTNRIDGKVVIITGCNTGIGKETALELAKRGAKIYMACRDPVRCEAARLEIVEKSKNENIFNRTLDLSSLESVRKFTDKFMQEESRLDILINNAGVMATPRTLTKDGFEQQLGVNHLGHFLLTNLLLDTLKKSTPSRIVVLSSAIYVFGNINKNDLNSEKAYSKVGAYSQSKLANILFTTELANKLKDTEVSVNCCHPGVVRTELGRHIVSGNFKKFVADPLTSYFFKTAKAGAQPSIRLALDPMLQKTSGGYYFDAYRAPVLYKAKDPEMATWLWETSSKMVALAPKVSMESTIVPENNGTVVLEVSNKIRTETNGSVVLEVPSKKDNETNGSVILEVSSNTESDVKERKEEEKNEEKIENPV